MQSFGSNPATNDIRPLRERLDGGAGRPQKKVAELIWQTWFLGYYYYSPAAPCACWTEIPLPREKLRPCSSEARHQREPRGERMRSLAAL